jgi:enoyl-CoA hydratase
VLDRPHVRNAVDRAHAAALADAFRTFDADPDASVAVLWGAGGTFCAGADLQAIARGEPNALDPDLSADAPMGPSRLALSKPVVAAVSGHAVAGGLELALWCDLRIVERDAVLGVFCRRWGVPLIDGGTVRLPRIVGLGRALEHPYGFAAFTVDPGRRPGDTTSLNVTYYNVNKPRGDLSVFETFTLQRPRSDGRR